MPSTELCSNDYTSKEANVMSPRGLLLLNYRNFCFLLEAEPTTSGNVYNPSNLSGCHHFSISIRILETKSHNKWKTLISKDQTKWIAWLSSLIFCGQCEILDFKKNSSGGGTQDKTEKKELEAEGSVKIHQKYPEQETGRPRWKQGQWKQKVKHMPDIHRVCDW